MNSFLFSAMLLKCSMISRLGAVEGHLVLDPKPITQLLADVNESPAQILAEVALWNQIRGKKELEPQDVKRVKLLRRIRHRIYFVKFLVESGQLVPDTQQMAWLSIHSKLP